MLGAIQLGHHKMLDLAKSRICFLAKQFPSKCLLEAVNGDEEAQIFIKTELLNSGLWWRANDLKSKELEQGPKRAKAEELHKHTLDFIRAHSHLVHPFTLTRDLNSDNDAVRMALNQIHYGSLRLSRQSKATRNQYDDNEGANHKEDIINFIFDNKEVVAEATMQGVIYNSDSAITEALNQIHSHSLRREKASSHPGPGTNSYKETLLTTPTKSISSIRGRLVKTQTPRNNKRVDLYFSGFSEDSSPEEIWKTIKQRGRVRDIVLPPQKDRLNQKYGFIKLFSPLDANAFLSPDNPVFIKDKRIIFDWAKSDRKHKKKAKPQQSSITRISKKKDIVGASVEREPQEYHNIRHIDSQDEGSAEWIDRINRSVRVEIEGDYAPDALVELLVSIHHLQVEVLKLGPSVFLVVCRNRREKSKLDLANTGLTIISQRAVEISDLILPRETGLRLQGLPVCAFSDAILKKVVANWGTLTSSGLNCIQNQHVINPIIRISTTASNIISERIMVHALGQSFEVIVTEERLPLISDCSHGRFRRDDSMELFHSVDQSLEEGEIPDMADIEVVNSTRSQMEDSTNSVEILSNDGQACSVSFQSNYSSQESDSEARLEDPTIEELEYRNLRTQDWNLGALDSNANKDGQGQVYTADSPRPDSPIRHTDLANWKYRESKSSEEDSVVERAKLSPSTILNDSSRSSIEVEEDSPMIGLMQKLKLKRNCGRSRKGRKLQFFDFKLKSRKNRYKSSNWIPGMYVRPWGTLKRSARSRKSNSRPPSSRVQNHTETHTAQAIWNLGERIGLIPLLAKDRTLALIAERIAQ
ncbi:hypothetical protein ACET3Z_000311 [Daucus carota]